MINKRHEWSIVAVGCASCESAGLMTMHIFVTHAALFLSLPHALEESTTVKCRLPSKGRKERREVSSKAYWKRDYYIYKCVRMYI